MIRFLRDSGIYKRGMERELGPLEAGLVTAGDAITVASVDPRPVSNSAVKFQFDKSTELPTGARALDGSIVALQSVRDITAAERDAPTAAMLADITTVYRLNVAPFTRYTSNGTALTAAAGGGVSQFSSLTDAGNVDLPELNIPLKNSLAAIAEVADEALEEALNRPVRLVSTHAEWVAAIEEFEASEFGGAISNKAGVGRIVLDAALGGLWTTTSKVSYVCHQLEIDHSAIVRGTSRKGKTDGTLHPAGSTVIRLGNTGEGDIRVGNCVMFLGPQNDPTTYYVTQGTANVGGGGTITLKQPLQVAIPAGNVQVVIAKAPGMMFDFVSAATSGPGVRKAKASEYKGFTLKGPGRESWGSAGLYTSGTQAGKAPRPNFDSVFVHSSETLIGGKNIYFLTVHKGIEAYQGWYGLWQEAGSDSGENISFYGGAMHFCRTIIRSDEPLSGIYADKVSLNHSQQALLVTDSANISMNTCHIENRAKGSSDDPTNYIWNGTGRKAWFTGSIEDDVLTVVTINTTVPYTPLIVGMGVWGPCYLEPGVTITEQLTVSGGTPGLAGTYRLSKPVETVPLQSLRAGIGDPRNTRTPGYDSFFEACGDTNVQVTGGGIMDWNTHGNATGPYGVAQYFAVNDAGSLINLEGMMIQNMANFCNQIWSGPGMVNFAPVLKHSTDPLMPTRVTSDQRENLFADAAYNTTASPANGRLATALGVQQNWLISQDSNYGAPASRFSGANVDLAIVTPAGGLAATITGTIQAGTRTLDITAITGTVGLGTEIPVSSGGTVYISDMNTVAFPGTGGVGKYQVSATQASTQTLTAVAVAAPGGVARFVGTVQAGTRTLVVESMVEGKVRRGMSLMGTSAVGPTIEGPMDAGAAAGGAGVYRLSAALSDTTTWTSKAMGAAIFRALRITAKGTFDTAAGAAAAREVSALVRAFALRRNVYTLLTYTPTASGLKDATQSNSIRIESNYCRTAPALDANGAPVILERQTATDASQWTPSAQLGSWEERHLRAYNVLGRCQRRFDTGEVRIRMSSLNVGGEFYIGLPNGNVMG